MIYLKCRAEIFLLVLPIYLTQLSSDARFAYVFFERSQNRFPRLIFSLRDGQHKIYDITEMDMRNRKCVTGVIQ
jgi:hypothetical protein